MALFGQIWAQRQTHSRCTILHNSAQSCGPGSTAGITACRTGRKILETRFPSSTARIGMPRLLLTPLMWRTGCPSALRVGPQSGDATPRGEREVSAHLHPHRIHRPHPIYREIGSDKSHSRATVGIAAPRKRRPAREVDGPQCATATVQCVARRSCTGVLGCPAQAERSIVVIAKIRESAYPGSAGGPSLNFIQK
jgi:hypothetical protein